MEGNQIRLGWNIGVHRFKTSPVGLSGRRTAPPLRFGWDRSALATLPKPSIRLLNNLRHAVGQANKDELSNCNTDRNLVSLNIALSHSWSLTAPTAQFYKDRSLGLRDRPQFAFQ